MIEIILVIVFLSVLILVHEIGHFVTAKRFGILVEEFGIGLPPRILGKKIGETIYSINALPFGGFVKIFGDNREEKSEHKEERAFYNLPVLKRAVVLLAGVVMNFVFGWLMFSVVFAAGVPRAVLIAGVSEGSPAQSVGLRAGESIVGFESSADLISYINARKGESILLQVERRGKTEDIKVTPRVAPPPGEGALGISLIDTGAEPRGILTSIKDGFLSSLITIGAIFAALYHLISGAITGQSNLFASVMGPIGIVNTAAQAANFGIVHFFQLIGLISLNLVVINILPFPGLDGGRLLLLLVERAKGTPLPSKVEQNINAAGIFLLILLMVALLISDAQRLL